MPFTFDSVDIRTELPDIPAIAPVVSFTPPCVKDRSRTVDRLSNALGFEAMGTVDVPHGYAVGGPSGQVEIFAASGAVRARNTDQLARYEDERRSWADVTRDRDGYRLGEHTAERLTADSLRLLDALGLADGHADVSLSLGQWALLDEKGQERESGPGRATVHLRYEAEGLPLIGPGAKTNLHYDPDESGEGSVLARFFHVNRAVEARGDVSTLPVDVAFEPLLTQEWSGAKVDPGSARLIVTSATVGLLALPADTVQRYAAAALMVEGQVEGALAEDGREIALRFGRYLPLTHPRDLAAAGFASSGPVQPGVVVKRRGKRR